MKCYWNHMLVSSIYSVDNGFIWKRKVSLLLAREYFPNSILFFFKENYVRKNFNPEAKGLAGLQWDSAELYKVSSYMCISFIVFSVYIISKCFVSISNIVHYTTLPFINYLHLLFQLMTSKHRGDYDSFTLQEVLIVLLYLDMQS